MFTITQDAGFKTVRLLLRREWDQRVNGVMAMVSYLSAKAVYDGVMERVPTKDDFTVYANSLEVVRVAGTKNGEAAFAVQASPKARSVRKVDAQKVVLYIRPRRKMARVPPQIAVLEKYNPWTLDLLPFMPKKHDALVIMRRVNGREVLKIAEQRRRDRPQWRKELARVGAVPSKKSVAPKVPKHAKAIPDVAFEALRLEFGLGVQPKPHWRPALRQFLPVGFRGMLRRMPGLQSALTKISFKGWRKWPPRVSRTIRVQDAAAFVPFQKKLNVRF